MQTYNKKDEEGYRTSDDNDDDWVSITSEGAEDFCVINSEDEDCSPAGGSTLFTCFMCIPSNTSFTRASSLLRHLRQSHTLLVPHEEALLDSTGFLRGVLQQVRNAAICKLCLFYAALTATIFSLTSIYCEVQYCCNHGQYFWNVEGSEIDNWNWYLPGSTNKCTRLFNTLW